MRTSVATGPAPSREAASSISFGTAAMKPVRRKTANGRETPAYTMISPSLLLMSPSCENSMNSG